MKKQLIFILLAAVTAMVGGCAKKAIDISLPVAEEEQVGKAIADQIIGTWVLVESDRPGTPSGIGCRLKFYTGTHWMITQPDSVAGLVVFHLGGRYTLEGDMLTEEIDFAGASTRSAIGGSGRRKITVDGDYLKQVDVDAGIYNETWKRFPPTLSSTEQDGK